MEGFVYIWFDKKHKRYYIGCHKGKEDDGYICSSVWMRNSYKRRPHDFKRRILTRVQKVVGNNLLEEEHRWLSLIKSEELGKRYYNLHNHHFGHWVYDTSTKLKTAEKISEATKAAMQRPEVQKRYQEGLARRQLPVVSTEERQRRMLVAMEKKYPKNQRKKTLKRDDPLLNEIYAQKSKEMWANRTEEEKAAISAKIRTAHKGKTWRKGCTNSPEHRAKISSSLKKCGHRPPRSAIEKSIEANRNRIKTSEELERRSAAAREGWARRKAMT